MAGYRDSRDGAETRQNVREGRAHGGRQTRAGGAPPPVHPTRSMMTKRAPRRRKSGTPTIECTLPRGDLSRPPPSLTVPFPNKPRTGYRHGPAARQRAPRPGPRRLPPQQKSTQQPSHPQQTSRHPTPEQPPRGIPGGQVQVPAVVRR